MPAIVIGGLEKKTKIITAEEKGDRLPRGWSCHGELVDLNMSPLVKVTIVPRGRSLGASWYLPDERHLTTTEQMQDEMASAPGGRAAEETMFERWSTGALSDLEKSHQTGVRDGFTIYG
ncbi:MAG: peptidase M41, partial [Flavobacteriales bacterium]|nr:peptidase M41 [Flavobacteriales bacterium]